MSTPRTWIAPTDADTCGHPKGNGHAVDLSSPIAVSCAYSLAGNTPLRYLNVVYSALDFILNQWALIDIYRIFV
ncbi:hypothetical protein NMY22_g18487 [Coprinellus aureogranulatus]|nr:hypothetical protein NMY22_g18487 [Coprinellus aureogranulatus]